MDLRSLKMAQGFAKLIATVLDDGTIIFPPSSHSGIQISLIPPAVTGGRATILVPSPVVITSRNYILVDYNPSEPTEPDYQQDVHGFTNPNLHRRIINDIDEQYQIGVFGQNSIRFYDDHFQEDQLPDEVP